MVEFVSYDGEYPCLCMGELVMKIDGVECHFHYKYGVRPKDRQPFEAKNCYIPFWVSGGRTYFTNDYMESHVENDEWELTYDKYPQFILDNLDEMLKVFNENVPHGCCGGCL